MVILVVITTFVVFVVVDLLLRLTLKRLHEAKLRKEREKVLEISLQLDYTDEAKSLTRVEVAHPTARILAVDDESVILDSFRKILVLAGYCVDTVETGKEALGLLRKNEYDFVFTDLKMPEMDGIEVTKAVRHLRPDIDVVVITGYATIESAVETMKYGAMDYVQKPFTADELTEMVKKLVIRRQARLDRETKPQVHLVTPSVGASRSKHEFNVPAGVFVSSRHSWVSIQSNGLARVGVDDFTQKTIGEIDTVDLPDPGSKVTRGEPLFVLRQGERELCVPAPISGKVKGVNTELIDRPELVMLKPYELGWICSIVPSNLPRELQDLKIGEDAVAWYRDEIDRCTEMFKKVSRAEESIHGEPATGDTREEDRLDDPTWEAFSHAFFDREHEFERQ